MQRTAKRRSSEDDQTKLPTKLTKTPAMARYCRRDLTCVFFVLVAVCLASIQVLLVYRRLGGKTEYGPSNVQSAKGGTFYHSLFSSFSKELPKVPIIIDWTNHFLYEHDELKTCTVNERPYQCRFSSNRNHLLSDDPTAITFYGTDMTLEDLPLPRKPNHVWALSHEESPKNNILFTFKGIMELFNFTSTFRRESHLPLTTQYVRSVEQLQSTKYMKSYDEKVKFAKDEGLADILYVQSDCGTPSDRDHFVEMLSKHIKIDSYGTCLHNKDLPKHLVDPIEGMTHADFIELFSKYKFAIAMENGICKDYITEKFWRPLYVGTIPIVLGSPSIQDFTPDEHSILDVNDFKSIEELVTLIKSIGSNEQEYDSYRKFKKSGVTNLILEQTLKHREWAPDMDVENNFQHDDVPNFPEYYSCKLCEVMHNVSKNDMKYQATVDHYGCPFPLEYADEKDLSKKRPFSDMWYDVWKQTGQKVDAFLEVSNGGTTAFKAIELDSKHREIMSQDIGGA